MKTKRQDTSTRLCATNLTVASLVNTERRTHRQYAPIAQWNAEIDRDLEKKIRCARI